MGVKHMGVKPMGIKRFALAFLLFGLLSNFSLAQLDSRSFSAFSNQPEPLPLDQAFAFYVSAVSPGRFKVNWNLAEGHYLYRHAFDFSMQQTSEAEALPVDFVLPDGLKKTDQFFGEIEAYYDAVSVELSLTTVPGPDAILVIQYQGCADWGFCYPPQRYEFILSP
ncbi:MAG: hypothetical protein HQ498_03870 [Pseudohongiella sp.]|nr:hypothetical protein [Pseudohongiella sp.]